MSECTIEGWHDLEFLCLFTKLIFLSHTSTCLISYSLFQKNHCNVATGWFTGKRNWVCGFVTLLGTCLAFMNFSYSCMRAIVWSSEWLLIVIDSKWLFWLFPSFLFLNYLGQKKGSKMVYFFYLYCLFNLKFSWFPQCCDHKVKFLK